MGILPLEIIASDMQSTRARRHMVSALNENKEELRQLDKHDNQNDVALWKVGDNKYSKVSFKTDMEQCKSDPFRKTGTKVFCLQTQRQSACFLHG